MGKEDNEYHMEDPWWMLELIFTFFFTVEFIARLAVADALGQVSRSSEQQGRCNTCILVTFSFASKPRNICDFLAILPFYIDLVAWGTIGPARGQSARLCRIARLVRLSRIARIARLAERHQLFGPVAAVLVVIWGIYTKEHEHEM